MKRILSIIAVIFTATILSGSGNKASVWKYELSLSFYGEFDSIPTINQFGQVRNGIIVDNIISVYNADPNGVDLTNTQIEAFRMLVGGMYTTGTWQKCKAIYPFIGGSEYKHKWNIKDLRDLDAAFRLQFFGGVHNSNGWVGNSSNRYANTYINANTLNVNSSGFGVYSNSVENSTAASPSDIRSGEAFFNGILLRTSITTVGLGAFNTTNNLAQSSPNLIGFTLTNKINSSHKIFNKGVETVSTLSTNANISNAGGFYYIGGLQSNTIYYTNKPYQLILFHNGLTDTEAIRLSTIVTQVQRHLSRQ